MRAYSYDYLITAQRIMGDMLDFAVNTCDMDVDRYFAMFLVSDISVQFQNGNPTYIAGKTGCEIVKEVVEESGIQPVNVEDEMYLDKSPEYWAGWALAYYQWFTCRPFMKINEAVPIHRIVQMYNVYHEMDITQGVQKLREIAQQNRVESYLKLLRKRARLSQSQLAEETGIPVKTIQQYEQRRKDINKAQAEYVIKLSQVLCCKPQELMEINE